MQEGILSLMQMAKTSCAVDVINEATSPFVTILTDPCTGGVVASFASLADICIAEPGARLYFTGPRVIQETTHEELPEGFGSAERNLRAGPPRRRGAAQGPAREGRQLPSSAGRR